MSFNIGWKYVNLSFSFQNLSSIYITKTFHFSYESYWLEKTMSNVLREKLIKILCVLSKSVTPIGKWDSATRRRSAGAIASDSFHWRYFSQYSTNHHAKNSARIYFFIVAKHRVSAALVIDIKQRIRESLPDFSEKLCFYQ